MTVEVAIGSRKPSRMIPVVAPVCSPQPEGVDAVRALDLVQGAANGAGVGGAADR